MLTVDQLAKLAGAYIAGEISAENLEDRYRDMSRGWYDRSGEPLSDLIAQIESALIDFEDSHCDERILRKGLANAILRGL